MKLIVAFFRLVRGVNLLFIALTQCLFQYCIVVPVFRQEGVDMLLSHTLFLLLMLASVLIAAGGYIINDYFDLNIDRINKPERMVVEKVIHRRKAIVWHLLLSSAGVLLSFFVGYKTGNIFLGIINTGSVLLLWIYSTTFKKRLLIGNIIISLLTAWVILVLYFVHVRFYVTLNPAGAEWLALSRVFKLAVVYGGFAFIISLIREVIKDLEDLPGDEKYGCRTMPIVWGIRVSKVFISTWLSVLIGCLVVIQLYILPLRWWWPVLYTVALILIPLLVLFRALFFSYTSQAFHALSNRVKWIMLAGILSMIFFKIYL